MGMEPPFSKNLKIAVFRILYRLLALESACSCSPILTFFTVICSSGLITIMGMEPGDPKR